VFISFFFVLKQPNLKYSSLNFVTLSWSSNTDEFETNWQNFAQVELQLKFALEYGRNFFSQLLERLQHCVTNKKQKTTQTRSSKPTNFMLKLQHIYSI